MQLYTSVVQVSNLYGYDAIRTAAASWSLLVMSRFSAMASTFSFSGISVHTVGIPISAGMMDSMPYMRANDNTPVGFRLVVL